MLSWKREHSKDKIKASNSMMTVETDNVNHAMALGLSATDAANLGQKLFEHVESLAQRRKPKKPTQLQEPQVPQVPQVLMNL
jgi:hypothetical protein